MNNLLNEDSKSQLLARSKSGANYAPSNQHRGKNRFQRRLYSSIRKSVDNYNSINMTKLFMDDILDVDIEVTGETDSYVVKIKMSGFMGYLQEELKKHETPLSLKDVRNALLKTFNREDVYVHCSCPDWKYRFGHWALKHSIDSYDDVFNKEGRIINTNMIEPNLVRTQAPQFDKTNKQDNKGAACKHVLLILNNNTWLIKVASVITNYIKWMEANMPDLYQKVIYPSIYDKKYDAMSQYDKEKEYREIQKDTPKIKSDKDTIDIANKYARTKTQFKAGNPYRFRPKDSVKKQFSFDDLVSDTDVEDKKVDVDKDNKE